MTATAYGMLQMILKKKEEEKKEKSKGENKQVA